MEALKLHIGVPVCLIAVAAEADLKVSSSTVLCTDD